MIELHNVTKSYGHGVDVLKNITMTLAAESMTFLTGHSGAGKSTLLKLIIGLEEATEGQVLVYGKNLKTLSRRGHDEHRRAIGMIFQDPNLLEDRTIFENVALPLTLDGYDKNEKEKRVHAALDLVGLLNKVKRYPEELSAGEQQRVGIARAIVNRPALILADEPTGNLDPKLAAEIMNLFARLNQTGSTVLIATHDLALIAKMHQPVITLSGGELAKALNEESK